MLISESQMLRDIPMISSTPHSTFHTPYSVSCLLLSVSRLLSPASPTQAFFFGTGSVK
jgi:hypothetical protein